LIILDFHFYAVGGACLDTAAGFITNCFAVGISLGVAKFETIFGNDWTGLVFYPFYLVLAYCC